MTYASRLRAKLDPRHPYNQSFGRPKIRVSDEMAEAAWQQQLRAGYDKRNIRCDVCFEYKSLTGECQCAE